jgi:hypothetical protein
MGNVTKDDIWKVVQMGLTMLVFPLAGWVWNMNVEVAEIRNDLGDAEKVIMKLNQDKENFKMKELALNSKIIGIEKDIEHMKTSLTRIEESVTK